MAFACNTDHHKVYRCPWLNCTLADAHRGKLVMQRGKQNKWRTESASKRGRQTNNNNNSKNPNPQIKKPTFFLPVSYSFIKHRFMLQKKKNQTRDLGLLQKVKTVLSKWRRFSVYTCRWCMWGTVCEGLSNIFLFIWTG